MSRVIGSYHDEEEAIKEIEGLKRQGYRSEDISVISKNQEETRHVIEETGTHAGEGAVSGALTGSAFGGLGGALAGLGSIAIPGIGPIVAAGPIVAGLTGAAAGAGVGGLAGALIGAGIPEHEAKEYETQVNAGRILVLVDDDSTEVPNGRLDTAVDEFHSTGSRTEEAHSDDSSTNRAVHVDDGNERDPLFGADNETARRGRSGL